MSPRGGGIWSSVSERRWVRVAVVWCAEFGAWGVMSNFKPLKRVGYTHQNKGVVCTTDQISNTIKGSCITVLYCLFSRHG